MNSYEEIKEILSSLQIKDELDKLEKLRISDAVHSNLPLSLELMSCDSNEFPSIDIDHWHNSIKKLSEQFSEHFPDEKYYLFIKAYPKNFMLQVSKTELRKIIFSEEFCYPFAIFSLDLNTFLIEEDYGAITSNIDFSCL